MYYCFLKEFNLNNKAFLVINKNKPQWKANLTNLVLQTVKDTPENKKLKSIRIILNSGKIFNSSLWEKLDKPKINKKNPPPIMNLSLKDLPNEQWKPLFGYEGKYVISNKGRVKRLSGWKTGSSFFEEEQILAISLTKIKDKSYLFFRLHGQVRKSSMALSRFLYYCFVEEFDLNDKNLMITNESKLLWDIELSQLLLRSNYSVLNGKNEK